MHSPIFIIGIPRTGSTLWSNVIARDTSIMRFGEMHYLNPWHKDFRTFIRRRIGGLQSERQLMHLAKALVSQGETPNLGLRGNFWSQIRRVDPGRLENILFERLVNTDKSLGAIFRIIIEEATRIRGYKRCLVKFPVYFNYLDRLFDWWPDARVIHITRDPRAIAVSKTRDPGGTGIRVTQHPWLEAPIAPVMKGFVVLQYNWESRVYQRFKNRSNYSLFKYEDLLAEPEGTIRELCEFASLEYTDSMLDPSSGQPSSITGVRRSGFDAAAATHWLTRLGSVEKSLISWATRSSSRRFGFDQVGHPVFRDDQRQQEN